MAYSTFNARAESIQNKPAFRSAFPGKRMAVIADGFYEWAHEGKEKQPFRFRVKSSKVFAFAGLYDHWKSPAGKVVQSCTIITTDPNSLTSKVHDCMPVILEKDELKIWLDPGVSDKDLLQGLLRPYDAEDMYSYPVSKAVGNVRNQAADLIKEIPLNIPIVSIEMMQKQHSCVGLMLRTLTWRNGPPAKSPYAPLRQGFGR